MWPFSDMSLSSATFWSDVANLALLSSLVVGVISTFFIVRLSHVKEHHWSELRRKSDEKIAEANARGDEAKNEAIKANVERLKLEEKLSPRSLSPEQQETMRAALSRFKGTKVDIIAYTEGSTPDTFRLANALAVTFASASWEPRLWTSLGGPVSVTGILVGTKDGSDANTEEAADAIILALKSERIDAARWEQQFKTGAASEVPGGGVSGPPWDANAVASIRLLVGSKT